MKIQMKIKKELRLYYDLIPNRTNFLSQENMVGGCTPVLSGLTPPRMFELLATSVINKHKNTKRACESRMT
jgi:hypothetical protein